ncbi:hypothetical protein QOZ80_8BG0658470 [Eleusine coracana subsp. coracana]|nr:hypothetical protein QOZ80_8BG0658470 [Eleusine coracana subsp. coracana]
MQVLELVLQRRVLTRGVKTVNQVLVKWSGMDESLATWEDLESLRQRFPRAPAWGQARSLGGGDVSTAATTTLEDVPTSLGPVEAKRIKRPNVRVGGPEWVNRRA